MINTTVSLRSIFGSVSKTVEAEANTIRKDVEDAIKGAESHLIAEVKKDTSRVIHSLEVKSIAAGKDITIQLDHAAGEVKRIVLNGTITVEGLIGHLLGLTAKPVVPPVTSEA